MADPPPAVDSEWFSTRETDGGVVAIELDADVEFCWPFRADLRQACRVASEREADAVVLAGEPDAFAMSGDRDSIDDLEATFGAEQELQATFEAVATLGAPVVAATQGTVRGFGLALALCADLRVASEDSEYGCPTVPPAHLATVGATKRLSATVGRDRAAEFLLSGTTYDAERMVDWGLLNELADGEAALDRALSLAEMFADRPTVVYEHMKHAVRAATASRIDGEDAGGRPGLGTSGSPSI